MRLAGVPCEVIKNKQNPTCAAQGSANYHMARGIANAAEGPSGKSKGKSERASFY
jgi:hypothetical protein